MLLMYRKTFFVFLFERECVNESTIWIWVVINVLISKAGSSKGCIYYSFWRYFDDVFCQNEFERKRTFKKFNLLPVRSKCRSKQADVWRNEEEKESSKKRLSPHFRPCLSVLFLTFLFLMVRFKTAYRKTEIKVLQKH